MSSTKAYAVVTFGAANVAWAEKVAKVRGRQKLAKQVYGNREQAESVAANCVGTGSCSAANVYECDSLGLAKSADISEIRPGERTVYQA